MILIKRPVSKMGNKQEASIHKHMQPDNYRNIHTWTEYDNRAQKVGQSLNVSQPDDKA